VHERGISLYNSRHACDFFACFYCLLCAVTITQSICKEIQQRDLEKNQKYRESKGLPTGYFFEYFATEGKVLACCDLIAVIPGMRHLHHDALGAVLVG
jgi:hypothetical protein